MAVKKLNKKDAKAMAIKMGISFKKDFHALSSSEIDILQNINKLVKYKKPKSASGSTMRYFYSYIEKA